MCVMVVRWNIKGDKCTWTGCVLKWYFIPCMEQSSLLETYGTDVRYRLPSTCSFYLKQILVFFPKFCRILSVHMLPGSVCILLDLLVGMVALQWTFNFLRLLIDFGAHCQFYCRFNWLRLGTNAGLFIEHSN
jgi:hypothetical protein